MCPSDGPTDLGKKKTKGKETWTREYLERDMREVTFFKISYGFFTNSGLCVTTVRGASAAIGPRSS